MHPRMNFSPLYTGVMMLSSGVTFTSPLVCGLIKRDIVNFRPIMAGMRVLRMDSTNGRCQKLAHGPV